MIALEITCGKCTSFAKARHRILSTCSSLEKNEKVQAGTCVIQPILLFLHVPRMYFEVGGQNGKYNIFIVNIELWSWL